MLRYRICQVRPGRLILSDIPRVGVLPPYRTVVVSSSQRAAMKDLTQPLASGYKPSEVEQGWYSWWESRGFFRRRGAQEKFVMVLPPPNITGTLHLGHALTCAVQDAIARWHQMRGHEVVWVPGCDHAGIATQVVVERYLWATEGSTRHQLGRERFVNEIWKWKEEKGTLIYDQMKRLGTSLDWDKAVFTMDAHMSEAVTEAFIQLYDSGLVYRKNALVNWCCSLQSAVSDIEVEHLHLTGPTELTIPGYDKPVTFGKMYDFAYKISGSDEELVVCTTRPETMLGDTAVMVHPEDKRYIHLHGRHIIHPFRKDIIPVITDSQVDPQFGTGVVKVTPGHSQDDYSVGQRHNLPQLTVFDEQGRVMDVVPEFKNFPRFKARQAVLEALSDLGLYRGCRAHPMMVPRCSRTQDVIEPLLKPQWFINCKNMAVEAVNSVRKGNLHIHPESYTRVWYEWLENINDWCVSRQLWWGHRIPAYCVQSDSEEFWVAARSIEDAKSKVAEKEGISELSITSVRQDEDVLDTWFSSALFPFAVFGWPEKSEALQSYYPTTLMETGHDILFFWVARMVMLGTHLTSELPFKAVLLHGLLCDAHGHKMSKSRGNVIDPIDVIQGASLEVLNNRVKSSEKSGILSGQEVSEAIKGQTSNFPNGIPDCGADALRFTLCSYNFKNKLLSVDINRMEQSKFLGNKIWQTVRFLLSALEKVENGTQCASHVHSSCRADLGMMDKWILSHMSRLICGSNQCFEAYDLHLVTTGFVTFWYNHLCDVYLESIKSVLKQESDVAKLLALQTLWTCVDVGLHAISPFMPFLTEELYQRLPRNGHKFESIMQCDYPQPQQWLCWRDQMVEDRVQSLLQVAAAFRALKTTYNITHYRVQGSVVSSDKDLTTVLRENLRVIKSLGRILSVTIIDGPAAPPATSAVAILSDSTAVYLHLEGVIDPKKELIRLRKKLGKLLKEESKMVKIVSSPGYEEKSPAHVQEAHLSRLASLRTELEQLQSLICSLEKM
ncbi:valine--tRNA ligase-like isoform X2 [Homarus americanus]|uniref:valine--tRNA ligase-like isoform X2 n=1 Tax=Homarus americanus TaxID=6706 RepID=UPI001C45D069|nr:valine--tRNA ligase-like isoform X2 [Homarus americanus]